MKTIEKIWNVVIGLLLVFAVVGFLVGRSKDRVVDRTEYIKENPITEKVTNTAPVSEEKPAVPDLPLKRDTIYLYNNIYVRESVDTAAIIAEYELNRKYEVPLFDNQYGKLDLTLSTQYNKLGDISYTFVPVRTIQYVSVKKTWQPFVSSSYSTLNIVGIGAGLFYHDFGLEYQFQYALPNNQRGHQFGLKWKF